MNNHFLSGKLDVFNAHLFAKSEDKTRTQDYFAINKRWRIGNFFLVNYRIKETKKYQGKKDISISMAYLVAKFRIVKVRNVCNKNKSI